MNDSLGLFIVLKSFKTLGSEKKRFKAVKNCLKRT